ncbi:MAG TPA: hypothetical protein VJ602_10750, partial [Paludibacter sp.]|nr:hypothetical protein [Paludibacter sp.]
MKKVMCLLFLIPFVFSSCSKKDDPSILDDYVGTWNMTSVGTIKMLDTKGTTVGSFSMDNSLEGDQITKEGNNLSIDDWLATVSGSSLSIESTTQPISMIIGFSPTTANVKYSGTITKNSIIITETYSGTWAQN